MQRVPHIDFGFREPALLRLHATGAKKVAVRTPTHLPFGRCMLHVFHVGDPRQPPLTRFCVSRLRLPELTPRLKDGCANGFDIAFPGPALRSVVRTPARHSAGARLVEQGEALTHIALRLRDISHLHENIGGDALRVEQVALLSRPVGDLDHELGYLQRALDIAHRQLLKSDELPDALAEISVP